jgi:replicative DNA helicase
MMLEDGQEHDEIPGLYETARTMERQVMAAALTFPDDLEGLIFGADDLQDDRHRLIWRTVERLRAKCLAADGFAVIQHLVDYPDHVVKCGGLAYLHDLMNTPAPTQLHLVSICRTLRFRKATADVSKRLHEGGVEATEGELGSVSEIAARVAREALTIAERVSTPAAHADEVDRVLDSMLSKGAVWTIPTGLDGLDRALGGLSSQGVTLVLAQSGMGKTSLCNRMVIGLCEQSRYLYLHGTETSTERRRGDLLSALARVPKRADFDGRQAGQQLHDAAQRLRCYTLEVTGSGLTVDELCARARQLHNSGRLDVLLVDYVQDLPKAKGDRSDTLEHIMRCSQTLKDLAAELCIPVVVFAQAKRPENLDACAKQPRPGMWDAQWASKLAQDAEECWVLYLEAKNRLEWPDEWLQRCKQPGSIDELEVWRRKGRDAAEGVARLRWHGPTKWIGEALHGFHPLDRRME